MKQPSFLRAVVPDMKNTLSEKREHNKTLVHGDILMCDGQTYIDKGKSKRCSAKHVICH